MKIFGIGIDIINCERIKSSLKKNVNFKKRIYSKSGITACSKKLNNTNCFAKKYAAKEAFVKALGTGFSKNLNFNEIEISNNRNGKPVISISGKSLKATREILKKKFYNIHLTISDEKKYAVAQVIITL